MSGLALSAHVPVVLVPGLSGAPTEDFAFLAPMLARHRRVLPVDLTALTNADSESTDSLIDPAAAETVIAATAEEAGEPVALVGVSVGAVLAMRVAARRPELVSQLVLVAGWLAPPVKLTAFADTWARLRREQSGALNAVSAAALTSIDGFERARGLPGTPATDRLVALAARLGAAGAESVRAPTLVIAADHDELAGPAESRLLFVTIPDARLATVPTGHAALVERPAEVLRLVGDFLERPHRHPATTRIPAMRP
ncbi:alpha/beta fold hydrolase [uncultured Amnibacterium sp.]|uniref:alpha/beta fold hydrolase n=1 Tax=uncultured Amnibacterium sp. TaxID=1631851 RepID=UPI0035CBDEC5